MASSANNINVTPAFILAGEATFTVSNGRGDHHTFHVYKSAASSIFPRESYFIKKLVGPDNTDFNSYKYLGMVIHYPGSNQSATIKLTGRSSWVGDSEPVKVARWALKAIWQVSAGVYTLPPQMSIKHVGRCGRCGAALTHPASLDTGLGPECASKAGVDWHERGVTFDLQEGL